MVQYFITRRVTTGVGFLLILLFGTIATLKLKIDLLPNISFPTLTIVTLYPNASPGEIETLISKPIEEIVASVPGTDRISSDSVEGASIVYIRFRWGTNMDQAMIQTREKVDLVKGNLPQDTKKSIVLRFDPNESPILRLAAIPKGKSLKDIRFFLQKTIFPYLERSEGVAAVSLSGGLQRQIQVVVDRDRLQAYGIGIDTVIDQISAANLNFPAGNIRQNDKEILIRTDGAFKSLDQINDTLIGLTEQGVPIYLKSIAEIKDGTKERTSITKLNSSESISISIKKESGKNTVSIVSNLVSLIEELNEKFNNEVHFEIVEDQSIFIKEAVTSVILSGLFAAVICYFILYLFYQNWREPIIVVSAIPLSSLLTLIFMYFLNITVNTMSMGGLALGVGMVVDSSAVVLESIRTKMKEMHNFIDAGISGVHEVYGSLIASTVTSCVVFLPVLFVDGIAGAIFSDFALTITLSLVSSFIVSTTLIPTLTQLDFFNVIPNKKSDKSKFLLLVERFENLILFFLNLFYKRKSFSYLLLIGFTLLTFFLFLLLPKEMMPELDQGSFTIKIKAPEGTTLLQTEAICNKLDQLIQETNDTKNILQQIGYEDKDLVVNPKSDFGLNRAEIFVQLKDGVSFEDHQEKIQNRLTQISKSSNSEISLIPTKTILASLLSSDGFDFNLEISGQNWIKIREVTSKIEETLKKNPIINSYKSSLGQKTKEVRVILDRNKMAFFGLTVEKIATNMKSFVKGDFASKFRENDYEFEILVRSRLEDRYDKDSILEIPIETPSGKMIKFSSFAHLEDAEIDRKIFRKDGSRTATLSLSTSDSDKEGLEGQIKNTISEYEQNRDVSVLEGDSHREMQKSFFALSYAAIFAIILVYMTMASQFENLVQPFIILSSIIITIFGSFLFLFLFGQSLNIISSMGIVLLAGLVVNNGIILVDTYRLTNSANSLTGIELLKSGIKKRLFTILNTTATTMLGMIPAIITFGNPSPQAPLAVAVIGGLFFSTIFSLVVIPILYDSSIRKNLPKVSSLIPFEVNQVKKKKKISKDK
ncbi:efflux RND transporter permease subunit [Leptospira sp. 201903075]|uniref:efflux RND transporter permease subunit n=1 Tax=Leptospira chreensis TaxID=2810035 RepID=UPI0019666DE1|nr:efflux RND transporter permease subunit [Leptospira chreensis]MBM9592387.1 efflux RND transporter permease subunit [Leptospira chreensis]